MKGIIHIKNGKIFKWVDTSKCHGTSEEIGYAHGVLLADELKKVVEINFYVRNYGYSSNDLANIFYDIFEPRVKAGYRFN